ncbi:hypothetical protein HDV62DRAFT_316552 [Trichoderma sp. SZMC 28011]
MLDTDLVTSPPSLLRPRRSRWLQLNRPASARRLRAPFRCAHFCSIACFYFSLSLTRTSYRAAGVARSPDLHLPAGATSGASASVLQPLHLRLAIRRTWACWEPLFSLLLDTVSDKTEGDGSREAIEGMSMSTELNEATRRRSRTVKTTGNIPGNAPSRCWEAHVQHEHAVPVLDLGAQVPTA